MLCFALLQPDGADAAGHRNAQRGLRPQGLRRRCVAEILPESRGFFVNTEMLTRLRLQRRTVAEAGVRHRPRVRGQSTVSLSHVPRVLGALLPFWWTRVLFAGKAKDLDEVHRRPLAPISYLLSCSLRCPGCCSSVV